MFSDITSKDGKYVAKLCYDESGETYTRRTHANSKMKLAEDGNTLVPDGPIDPSLFNQPQEFIFNKYVVVNIYKYGCDVPIHSYKESNEGPKSHAMIKAFIEINGVTWFIGSLNYIARIYVNCETGESYTSNGRNYGTWYRIVDKSPDGRYIAVNTYTFGGNDDSIQIYDVSDLAGRGAVLKHLDKVPCVFNIDYCEMKFAGPSSVELSYYNEFTEEYVTIGIFEIV